MANQERGELGVDVGGKRYTLRPTFDSICELEELLGKPIDVIKDSLIDGRRSGMRAVVWCCLQDEHADEIKALKDASRWIERAGGQGVVAGWIERLFSLNADEETGGEANPPDAQAGTGENSSPVLVASV
jgi:hypothetical protein